MTKAERIDGIQYLRTLTPKRLWNAALVLGSYFISKWTKKNHHSGYPIALSIEPTTSCNLRCPECPSGLRAFSRPTGMLEKQTNQKIIDELHPSLTYITYYFQGEPYLNPDFTDMVAYASERKIYTATSTNAHYLTEDNCRKTIESGLSRLIISVDGVDQESYATYRKGGQLNKVLEGTARLVETKRKMKSKTPFIIWQFIVFSHNEHQVDEVKTMAREMGVDHVAIKTAQLYGFEDKLDMLPKQDKYRRYEVESNSARIKNKLLNHCWRMWHACVITWDGKVAPCCFDKDASHQLGDVHTNGFGPIWKGKEYNRFRRLVLKSRSNIDICQNCSEGTKIWG